MKNRPLLGGFLKSDFIVQDYYLHGDACEWNDSTINKECEDYVNKRVTIYGNFSAGRLRNPLNSRIRSPYH